LITASVQAGAVAGGADAKQFSALTMYGNKIGLTFQIVDDLLNVEGTLEQLGKTAGTDAAREKQTYPAFFGVAETKKLAHENAEAAVDCLSLFNETADPLRELARYIVNRKR
jgi:geranylgeranyl diphosphate synthase type II